MKINQIQFQIQIRNLNQKKILIMKIKKLNLQNLNLIQIQVLFKKTKVILLILKNTVIMKMRNLFISLEK